MEKATVEHKTMTKPQPCPTPPRYDEDYFEMMDVLDARKKKMTNPCPYHKDVDPAVVPTGEPTRYVAEKYKVVHCVDCWQRHAEWQKETYEPLCRHCFSSLFPPLLNPEASKKSGVKQAEVHIEKSQR